MFNAIFYRPIYNILVVFIDKMPNNDAGLAVVFVTIIVSLALFSISKKAIKTQLALKVMEPELARIREEITNKEEQAKQTLALYKKYKVNPFSMILLVIIQFPILIALYYAFKTLPTIHTNDLYSFVASPLNVNMLFLGALDISKKSLVLAVLAGITQFIQAYIVTSYKAVAKEAPKTTQEQLAHSMQMQMKYFLPVFIGIVGASLPAALPLYWCVRNVFTSLQELFVRKRGLKA